MRTYVDSNIYIIVKKDLMKYYSTKVIHAIHT